MPAASVASAPKRALCNESGRVFVTDDLSRVGKIERERMGGVDATGFVAAAVGYSLSLNYTPVFFNTTYFEESQDHAELLTSCVRIVCEP